MKVLLNKWQGHEKGFAGHWHCDECGEIGTVAVFSENTDHIHLCLPCLVAGQKAIQEARLEDSANV